MEINSGARETGVQIPGPLLTGRETGRFTYPPWPSAVLPTLNMKQGLPSLTAWLLGPVSLSSGMKNLTGLACTRGGPPKKTELTYKKLCTYLYMFKL